MRNRALRWIDLHEDQMRKQLSEVDSLPDGMAASSPSGVSEDLELQLWEQRAQENNRPASLDEFREQAEFIRHRLTEILKAVEPLLQSSATDEKMSLLPKLQAAYSEFLEIRRSGFAWQVLHGEDPELLSQAIIALRKLYAGKKVQ